MEKARTRALRRWRSFTKWMRRLRSDWNEHGWRRDPIRESYLGQVDGTSLCNCFFLDNPQALRFKDTPKSCSCIGCGNPRRWSDGKNSTALTFQEKVLDLRDNWNKRERRMGTHPFRVLCKKCGVMVKLVRVRNGYHYRDAKHIDKICSRCDSKRQKKDI